MLAVVLVRSVYASQRPSGENSEFRGANDSTTPNRSTFLSAMDNVHSDAPRDVVALKDSCVPLGDHDSGMCETSLSGAVSRSTAPVPSARCQYTLARPSRSD